MSAASGGGSSGVVVTSGSTAASAVEVDAPMSSAAIAVCGVVRAFKEKRNGRTARVALGGVSFSLETGRSLALLGPNGAGKSTLLRILSTLDVPDEGEVRLLGELLPSRAVAGGGGGGDSAGRNALLLDRIRRKLGVVFQTVSLDPLLTIRENLRVHASTHGLVGGTAGEAIERTSRMLGVHDRLDDRVGVLSGGLARRADLARALLHNPGIVLLDEPTTGLDPNARRRFLDALDEMRSLRPDVSVLLSTHLIDEADRCDRVVMLHEGSVVADGTPVSLRSGLGPMVVRCRVDHGDARAVVAGAAVEHLGAGASVVERGGRVVVVELRPSVLQGDSRESGSVLDVAGFGAFAASLAAAGVPFEVTPPTLDDVFANLTGGRSIDEVQP